MKTSSSPGIETLAVCTHFLNATSCQSCSRHWEYSGTKTSMLSPPAAYSTARRETVSGCRGSKHSKWACDAAAPWFLGAFLTPPPPAAWFWGSAPPPGGPPPWPGRGTAAPKAGGAGGHDGGQLSITCPETQKEGKARGPRPCQVPGTEQVLHIDSVPSSLPRDAVTPAHGHTECVSQRRGLDTPLTCLLAGSVCSLSSAPELDWSKGGAEPSAHLEGEQLLTFVPG